MTILIRAINQTTGAFGGVRLAAVAALGAVGVAMAYSVKQAAAFQTGLTVLSTGAGESARNLQMVGNGIKQISIDTATTTDQLLKGAFMIESAGYHGQNALNVLKVAAEGAKLENTDLGATANTLTSLLHDYGMASTQAGAAMSGLIQTEADGKMHMSDLTKAMGNVMPLAADLGVKFPEIGAAIAVMTNSGMTAMRATQNLNFALRALGKESSNAQLDALQEVGLTADQVNKSLRNHGLLETLTLVEDAVGKKFPVASAAYNDALSTLMGGATGWNVALKLSGQHLQEMQKDIKNISGAMGNSTTLTSKWAQMQGTFNFQLDQTKAALNVAAIDLGTLLLPALEKVLGTINPLIAQFTNWVETSQGLHTAITSIGDFMAATLVPAIQTAATWTGNLVLGMVHLYQAFQQGQPYANAIAIALGTIATAIALIKIEEKVAGWVNWFDTMREGNGVIANLAGNTLPELSKALGWQKVAQDEATASTAAATAATQESVLQTIAASSTKKAEFAAANAAIIQAQLDEAATVGGASAAEIKALTASADAAEKKAVRLQGYAAMAETMAAEEAAAIEAATTEEVAAGIAASTAITIGLSAATLGISLLVGAAIAGIAASAATGQATMSKATQDAYNQLGKSSDDNKARQKIDATVTQVSWTSAASESSGRWQVAGEQMAKSTADARAKMIADQQKIADAASQYAQAAADSWSNFISQMHAQGIDPQNGGKWNPNTPSTSQRGRVAPPNLNNTDQSWNVGHASGIFNTPYGHWAMVGERGPELMYVPKGSNIYPNGTGPGGGHTINVFVSTMAGSRAEVMRMVDLLESEIAHRFRSQTPSFALPGLT